MVRYLCRPAVAADRLSELPDGRFELALKSAYRDGTKTVILSALDLTARLAAVMPLPRTASVRYHGFFAPHAKLRPLVVLAGDKAPTDTAALVAGRRFAWAIPSYSGCGDNWARCDLVCQMRRCLGVAVRSLPCAIRLLAQAAVTGNNQLGGRHVVMLRSVIAALSLALLATVSPAAHAADSLDIGALLAERGTRLLVVEFYATWCGPCMAAMPRWRALKEKFATQGLRIVVVNTQDPDGGCKALPFSPDVAMCDLEGNMANGMSVGGKLPAAFLWSWQGNLLVQKGHVDAVEQQIERYLRAAPRVLLQKDKDVPAAALVAVREALARDGKVLVAASAEERRLLDRARQAAAHPRYDEKAQCQLGAELPPNAILEVSRVAQGKASFLNVSMRDLQTGCAVQSGSGDWKADANAAADEAVAKLLRKLRRDRVQMPGAAGLPAPAVPVKESGPQVAGGAVDAGDSKGPAVVGGDEAAAVGRLIVTVQPKDAVVEVAGPHNYRATGRGGFENSALPPGKYDVEVTATGHESAKQRLEVIVDDVKTAKVVLQRFGSLQVVGTPVGAKVEIRGPDGFAATQGLPVTVSDARKGEYTVAVAKAGFEPERYTAIVKNGEPAAVTAKLLALGALSVEGTPVGARVEIQGPDGFEAIKGLPVKVDGAGRGSYVVKASRPGYVAASYKAEVRPGATATVEVSLRRVAEAAEPGHETEAVRQDSHRPGSTPQPTSSDTGPHFMFGRAQVADGSSQIAALERQVQLVQADKAKSAFVFAWLLQIAAVYESMDDKAAAAKTYQRVVALFNNAGFARDGGPQATAAAQAAFKLMQPRYDAFIATSLVKNTKLPPEQRMADLQQQVKTMMDQLLGPEVTFKRPDGAQVTERCGNCPLDNADCRAAVCKHDARLNGLYDEYLSAVVVLGAQDWAYAAFLFRARLLRHFYRTIYGAPRPPDMTEEETEAYEAFFEKAGAVFADRAVKSLQLALSDAKTKGVTNQWVSELKAELEQYVPRAQPTAPQAPAAEPEPWPAPAPDDDD